jgi:hypothetical protein
MISIWNDLCSIIHHLFEQWSTYVDALSITQQEIDSLEQLVTGKQDDLEKLQFDIDLTISTLIQLETIIINSSK